MILIINVDIKHVRTPNLEVTKTSVLILFSQVVHIYLMSSQNTNIRTI